MALEQMLVEWIALEMERPLMPEPDVAAPNVVTNALSIDRV